MSLKRCFKGIELTYLIIIDLKDNKSTTIKILKLFLNASLGKNGLDGKVNIYKGSHTCIL